jgi:hypothetical protein
MGLTANDSASVIEPREAVITCLAVTVVTTGATRLVLCYCAGRFGGNIGEVVWRSLESEESVKPSPTERVALLRHKSLGEVFISKIHRRPPVWPQVFFVDLEKIGLALLV